MLICKNDKISVLKTLGKYIVNWYHTYILNAGMERIEATIIQQYYWPHLRKKVHTHCKLCMACKKNKKKNRKTGKLPTTEAEAIPWDRLLVDHVGP